ncbi:hypothetical protein GCM10009634_21660 [Saccharothrix xinjiangensis]
MLLVACLAVVTTVAGLAFAWSTRPGAPAATGVEPPLGELRCGAEACRTVVEQQVGPDSVALLVGPEVGRIRTSGASGPNVFELTVAASGAEITDRSLQCADAGVGVCLVRGEVESEVPGEVLGEVLVRRSGAWSRAQVPYVSSGGHLALHDVDRDAVADVVAVQRECPAGEDCPRRFVQVFSLVDGGEELGCTEVVDAPELVPGWPAVVPDAADLGPCGD